MNRRPFIRKVLGDALAPLRTDDMLLFEPADRKRWDGMYAFRDGGIYMAQTVADGIRLWSPNPRYAEWHVPREWFNANVCGWKIAEIRFDGLAPGELRRVMAEGFDFDVGTADTIESQPLALEAAPPALAAA